MYNKLCLETEYDREEDFGFYVFNNYIYIFKMGNKNSSPLATLHSTSLNRQNIAEKTSLNETVVEPVIEGIIQTIIASGNVKDENFTVPYSTIDLADDHKWYKKTYDIPYDKYVFSLYQIAQGISTQKHREGMVEIMYDDVLNRIPEKLRGTFILNKSSCVSLLNIKLYDKTVLFGDTYISYADVKDYKFILFVKDILARLERCGAFATIAVNLQFKFPHSGHRNIIFIEQTDKLIAFNYYEPYGLLQLSSSGIEEFLESLEIVAESLTKKEIKINIKEATCPTGMQSVTRKYDVGYCIMFSLLWMYAVFSVVMQNIAAGSYTPTSFWIQRVEEYFLSRFKNNQRELYNIVVGYAATVFVRYIEDTTGSIDHTKVLNKLYNVTNLKKGVDNLNSIKSHTEYLPNYSPFEDNTKREQEIFQSANNPSYSKDELIESDQVYDAYELEEKNERKIHPYNQSNKSNKSKQYMNDTCVDNSDCHSECCEPIEDFDEQGKSSFINICVSKSLCKTGKAKKSSKRFSPGRSKTVYQR